MVGMDAITINRPMPGADADGNVEGGFELIANTRGTLGTPTQADIEAAGQLNTQVDQVLALRRSTDIRDADQVVTPRGTFEVVSVAIRRLYLRALIRKIV